MWNTKSVCIDEGISFLRANGVKIEELKLPCLTTYGYRMYFRRLKAQPFYDENWKFKIKVTGTYEYSAAAEEGSQREHFPFYSHKGSPIGKVRFSVVVAHPYARDSEVAK